VTINFALISYLTSGIAFTLLTVGLLTVWRSRFEGTLLAVSTGTTAIWSAVLTFAAVSSEFSRTAVFVAEMLHDAAWLLFLSSLLAGAITSSRTWLVRYAGVALTGLILVTGIVLDGVPFLQVSGGVSVRVLVLGSIVTSLFGLISIEQVFRNARPLQKSGLKYLCLGVAGIFAYDVFMYSDAVFTGEVGSLLWESRGFVIAMCAPLIAVAAKRKQSWAPGIFVSRQVVFYTTTMVGAGVYLAFVGLAGYYVQQFDQNWGPAIQLIISSAAVLIFIVLVMSERTRAKAKVFITKHFFENKFDYREEWLRLIQTLTTKDDNLPLQKRAIQSLAQIIDSPSGELWMREEDGTQYVSMASWNMAASEKIFPDDHNLISFLEQSGWVLDLEEVRTTSGMYGTLTGNDLPKELDRIAVVIPLTHEDKLIGFVGLSHPRTPISLNFEDHDLLKTAGKQIASYLGQEIATAQLTESRQFEAFNRLTAYIMHDLKNAIAQQTLVVENAEKHKRNPEFVDDAIETIKGSVSRIRRVVSQLQQAAREGRPNRVDVTKLVAKAISQCKDRNPVPREKLCKQPVFVFADYERLLMAVCHAIRNAQDATSSDGIIDIELTSEYGNCIIRITDNGRGMDAAFVRDRLFRPFDSTKGTQGMGIGAYQIRETARAAHGDVEVTSVPDEGTSILLKLPTTD
jgi:putative PEP-CTERM system histidine kinase